MSERIAKYIAGTGHCSRRAAEALILEGRVRLNNVPVTTPVTFVEDQDKVTVDGKSLAPRNQRTRLWLYYKPKGLVTTHQDPEGRPTVFASLPKSLPRVVSVGRLDLNSEGLLLLTNDGHLARYIELPKTGWPRSYHVRVRGNINNLPFEILRTEGVTIDGFNYQPMSIEIAEHTPRKGARVKTEDSSNNRLNITITEGKNREIRKIMEHFGLQVNQLIRVGYGPFWLDDLMPGKFVEVERNIVEKIGTL